MIRAVTPATALEALPHLDGELLGDLDNHSAGAPQHPLHLFDLFAVALKLLVATLYRLRGRGPLQHHPALGSGDVMRPDVHTRLPILQPRGLVLVTVLQGVPVLLLQAALHVILSRLPARSSAWFA